MAAAVYLSPMEREASSMPGRGNNIIAYYRNYIISDFYNFIISEYCNFRNIYFHKFYIAVFRKKEASAICYIVALPLPHQRGKFLFCVHKNTTCYLFFAVRLFRWLWPLLCPLPCYLSIREGKSLQRASFVAAAVYCLRWGGKPYRCKEEGIA